MKKRDKYKLSQGKLDEFKDVFEKAVQKYHEETQQAVREVTVTYIIIFMLALILFRMNFFEKHCQSQSVSFGISVENLR